MPGQYPGLEKYASQFIKKHRNALVGAGIGALLSGTVGALGTRGGKYETDEELNRRRWRNGIIAGILGAGVGGLAGNYISNNQKIKQHSKIIADKTKELKSKLVPQKATQPVNTPTPTETPITPSYNNSAKPSAAVTTPKEVPSTTASDTSVPEAYEPYTRYHNNQADTSVSESDESYTDHNNPSYISFDPGLRVRSALLAGTVPYGYSFAKDIIRWDNLEHLEHNKTKDLFDKRTALEKKYADYNDKPWYKLSAEEQRWQLKHHRRLDLAGDLIKAKIEKINQEIRNIRKPIFGEIDAIKDRVVTPKGVIKTIAKKGLIPAVSTYAGTYLAEPAINYLYKNISN